MDELLKALGPWPMVQGIAIGLIVGGLGFYAMRLGLRDRRSGEPSLDALKAQWAAYEHLDHIHENSFAIVKHMEKLVELQLMTIAAINRLADNRWNKHQ
jgi:hypothetical protein